MADNHSEKQYAFDVNKSPLFKKDSQNLINVLGIAQLNTLQNVSLLDIFLSDTNAVEPHYHPNAAELVYCISGSAIVSMLNPSTKEMQSYRISPGQVANVPQGWWHYEVAQTDRTHLLAIFDADTPEVILGSDILKFTPSSIIANTYSIDENLWKKAVSPVVPSTYIGPPANSSPQNAGAYPEAFHSPMHPAPATNQYQPAPYPLPYQHHWRWDNQP